MNWSGAPLDAVRVVAAIGPHSLLLLGCAVALSSRRTPAWPAGALVLLAWAAAAWPGAGAWATASVAMQGGCALALLALAVRSRPYWILAAAAFQLLAVLTQIVLLQWAGWRIETAASVWSMGLGLVLILGGVRRAAASPNRALALLTAA